MSSYNMFGNIAAKRHNYMVHHKETHVPDDRCTIYEKVMCLRDKDKDLLKSVSSSSRGLLTPRWSTARSRTPSRPRSMPGTPRSATPNGLRRSDSRERYQVPAAVYDSHSRYDAEVELGRSGIDTFAVEHIGADSFAIGAAAGRSRTSASNVPVAAPLAPSLTPARADARAQVSSSTGSAGAGAQPPIRTPPAYAKGSGYDYFGSRGGYAGTPTLSRYPPDNFGRPPVQADARATSFVRLNNFLLRTHVTSLVSALAEDGWLEAWEKERLCAQAREDSPAWAQAFFRGYMRFMESEDVPAFVASLRSQIV